MSENYYAYRFNTLAQKQSMPIAFVPDVMFILNTTDADFYLTAGSIRIPTPDNYDILVPANSYYSFIPQRETREYGGLLNNPTAWDCIIWFRRGLALLDEINYPIPDLGIVVPLSPMPDPTVTASFTFVVL